MSPELASETADLNLTYLLLSQKLLRHDRAAGLLRLGISAEVADFVLGLSPSQIINLSSTDAVLCGFRQSAAMPAVIDASHQGWLQRAHHFIVLAAELREKREEEEMT